MEALFLLAIAAVPLIVTVVAIVHPSQDFLWGHRIVRMALAGKGPYRARRELDVADMREPRVVRATSILTAFLGGMIVPGGLAAIVGVIVMFVMLDKGFSWDNAEARTIFLVALSAPSGVAIAFRCLRVYTPMLENRLDAPARMRSLAVHSGLHNAALLAVYAAYGLSERAELAHLMWATYPLVSFLHAVMLAVSARAIERCRAEHERAELALADQGACAPAGPPGRLPAREPRRLTIDDVPLDAAAHNP